MKGTPLNLYHTLAKSSTKAKPKVKKVTPLMKQYFGVKAKHGQELIRDFRSVGFEVDDH